MDHFILVVFSRALICQASCVMWTQIKLGELQIRL